MKEIVTWGDVEPQFKRLGIEATKTFEGSDDTRVYEVTDEAFAILDSDQDEEAWRVEECAWRYAEGSSLGQVNKRFSISGRYLKAWARDEEAGFRYRDIREYLENEIGATTERNVVACCTCLAKQNNLKLSELFQRFWSR